MPHDRAAALPEAGGRFRTLEMDAVVTHDTDALGRLMRREAAGRGGQVYELRDARDAGDADGRWARFTQHVWWEPPSRLRYDWVWPGGQRLVRVVRDDVRLAYVPGPPTLYTTEPVVASDRWPVVETARAWTHLATADELLAELPLLRPGLPDAEWERVAVGTAVVDGRPVRRVRATRRAGAPGPDDAPASGYWPGVDAYECLVDDALGVLVRFTGLDGGVPVASVAATRVRTDVPLPADRFTFVPPPGTRLVHVYLPPGA